MRILGERFEGVFRSDSGAPDPLGALARIEVHRDTTADDLYGALRRDALS